MVEAWNMWTAVRFRSETWLAFAARASHYVARQKRR